MDPCDIRLLRPLLERNGFSFSKNMGQNFLVESWVPERIALESGADKTCGVLEIGPGAGSLTSRLVEIAGKVAAVELDKRLPPVLAEVLGERENFTLVMADALKLDLAAFAREHFEGLRPMVCANLPYNITTPIITALIEAGCFEAITVMVQKEVAQRFCAKPGKGDYGAFTVFVNCFTEPEMIFTVPPSCFLPQPKVTSAVVRLKKKAVPDVPAEEQELFFRVVRAAFDQRRKTLPNALAAAFGQLDKAQITAAVESCGLSPTVRGEALDTAMFSQLARALKGYLT